MTKSYNQTSLVKNGLVTTQVKPSLVTSKVTSIPVQQIIPPNPINPFSNPARITPQLNALDTLPSIYKNQTSLENFNDLTGNEDVSTQIREAIEKFFNDNGADIVIGLIGLGMVLIAIVQIVKPI
jgi:hypothetical protein